MVTLKNIFQTIILTTCLLKIVDGVGSSDKNTQIPDLNDITMDINEQDDSEDDNVSLGDDNVLIDDIPDLNDTSMEMKEEQEKCVDSIYTHLKCKRPMKHREDIAKKVFGTINIDSLQSGDAAGYFMYLHDIIIPTPRNTCPFEMMTPQQFCEKHQLAMIHDKLRNKSCIQRIAEVYNIREDSNDKTSIMRAAFKHLSEDKIFSFGDYAYRYFKHMIRFIGFIDGKNAVLTPVEFCARLSEPRVRVWDYGASSSKSKKSESSNA